MSLLVILGIWIVVSAIFAPIVGYFLAGHRTRKTSTGSGLGIDLHPGSRPRV